MYTDDPVALLERTRELLFVLEQETPLSTLQREQLLDLRLEIDRAIEAAKPVR